MTVKSKPNRFLVVKFGSLGDIVECLPSVAQLRKAFPEAEIDWLIERKNKGAVELSGVDVDLVPIDTYQWRHRPGLVYRSSPQGSRRCAAVRGTKTRWSHGLRHHHPWRQRDHEMLGFRTVWRIGRTAHERWIPCRCDMGP